MKKIVCFILTLLIVFTAYADTTYIATAGRTPAEFTLQAYKNNNAGFTENWSIVINNHVEKEGVISDSEQNRFYITTDNLDGKTPLFDIVYTTNTFNEHVDFTVDISMFELEEGEGNTPGKIDIIPKIKIDYSFKDITVRYGLEPDYYSFNVKNPPPYITNRNDFDSIRSVGLGEYSPQANLFELKYNGNPENDSNRDFKLNSKLGINGTGGYVKFTDNKATFSCYPSDSFYGPVHLVVRGHNNETNRYVHNATAVFTATAYVSLPDNFNVANYNGRYIMNVNIRAEISGS